MWYVSADCIIYWTYTENIQKILWCLWYISVCLADCIIYWKYSKIVMMSVVCLCMSFCCVRRSHICYTCIQFCFSMKLYTFFLVFQVELLFSEVGQAHLWLHLGYSMQLLLEIYCSFISCEKIVYAVVYRAIAVWFFI